MRLSGIQVFPVQDMSSADGVMVAIHHRRLVLSQIVQGLVVGFWPVAVVAVIIPTGIYHWVPRIRLVAVIGRQEFEVGVHHWVAWVGGIAVARWERIGGAAMVAGKSAMGLGWRVVLMAIVLVRISPAVTMTIPMVMVLALIIACPMVTKLMILVSVVLMAPIERCVLSLS